MEELMGYGRKPKKPGNPKPLDREINKKFKPPIPMGRDELKYGNFNRCHFLLL